MSYSIDIKVENGEIVVDVPDAIKADPSILPLMIRVTGHHVRPGERSTESVAVTVLRPHSTLGGDEVEFVLSANAGAVIDRTSDTTA